MHTNWCVLIEISMEIGMLNFWLGLLVTAQTKENYFSITCLVTYEEKNKSNVNEARVRGRTAVPIATDLIQTPNNLVRNALTKIEYPLSHCLWAIEEI